MPLPIATLNAADLPVSFKYIPFIVPKRTSVRKTANAVVTQAAAPSQVVAGDGIITWNIQDARPTEFEALFILYNTTNLVPYTFEGYWNDEMEVYFSDFKIEKVFGRFFSLTGEFQVISVTSSPIYNALTCGY